MTGSAESMPRAAPLSVAVLLELERTAQSGGHVKSWEHWAAAAAGRDDLDLTIYVLGSGPVDELSANVRFVPLRPVLSTRPVHGLVGGVDIADIAPFHPGLARRLPTHQVWHLTHTFAFGATARRLARRHGRALVASMHTDVPALTKTYASQVIARLPANVGSLLGPLQLERVAVGATRRARDRMLGACEAVLVSSEQGRVDVPASVPPDHVSLLRRGLNTTLFRPDDTARRRLSVRYGVPEDGPRVLFAGRVDASKGALIAAEAVRRLSRDGVPAHLVVAGRGADTDRVRSVLGGRVSLLGHLPQADLAGVYAGCDTLAFPSRSETVGNVVLEAMSTGLAPVLPAGATTTQWLDAPGSDGVIVTGDESSAWAHALGGLLAEPGRARSTGLRARATAQRRCVGWAEVLEQDLMPVWRAAADRQRG